MADKKKFSMDDFLKLPRSEQKALFKILYNSYGGQKSDDPIKTYRKKRLKRGGKT